MDKFRKLFKTKKPIIGMVHLMPLLGYEEFPGIDKVLKKAIIDAKTLEKGGVNGILIENNYDYPHAITVGPETVACMSLIVSGIKKRVSVPLGICVLWNDFEAAFSIASTVGAQFVRVPGFLDKVKTSYGIVKGDSKAVNKARIRLKAEKILLFVDIHVKHSQVLNSESITQSAKAAIKKGADGVIVTGKWTADSPAIEELEVVKKEATETPVIVGSGATYKNVRKLLTYADAIIVGTALKTGAERKENINIKSFEEKVSLKRVKQFMKEVKI